MDSCEAARRIAGDLDEMIKRADEHGLETVRYVLETARIEALRATRPQPVKSSIVR